MKSIAGLVCLLVAILPGRSDAAACDEWLNQTIRLTGSYVPSEQAYARSFVFAMLVDCKGGRDVVTVQRATGTFPVCGTQESVAVVGKLIWNRALVQGHYAITNPTSVTCEPAGRAQATGLAAASSGPAPGSAPAPPVAQGTAAESIPGGTGSLSSRCLCRCLKPRQGPSALASGLAATRTVAEPAMSHSRSFAGHPLCQERGN